MSEHVHHGKSSNGTIDLIRLVEIMGIKNNNIIADIGCGDGYISMFLSKYLNNGKVIAIEPHLPSLELLKSSASDAWIFNIEYINGSITEKLEITEGSVDIALLVNVFHGISGKENIKRFCNNIKNMLKSGGKLVLVEFQKKDTEVGPPIKERLSLDEMENILTENDFSVLEKGNLNHIYSYIIVKLLE